MKQSHREDSASDSVQKKKHKSMHAMVETWVMIRLSLD